MIIYYDIETKSKADLPSVGARRYSENSSTDVICLAFAVDDNPVEVWLPGQPIPEVFNIADTYIARNILFELAIAENVLVKKYGFPSRLIELRRCICTAALSRMSGLPGSLEPCAEVINKTHKKLSDGKRLINLYSKPMKDRKTGVLSFRPIPDEDMRKFIDYNIEDVETDRECFKTLIQLPNWWKEKEVFYHDLEMNINGIKVDTAALEKVLNVFDIKTASAEADQDKFGVNTRSPKQLIAWLAENGYKIDDCRIETIEDLYEETADEDVKQVLALRMFLGKASVKKYQALFDRVSDDGRLRYFMRYFGGHTGRYSGEGFQPHNLPKSEKKKDEDTVEGIKKLIETINPDMDYKELIEAGKKILPGLILPDKGQLFILGDFAAIEARGIAYLAGCESLLAQFRDGEDVYMTMAKKINPQNPDRKLGKTVILGSGYGMGVDKFYETCHKQGLKISHKESEISVKTFRATYSEIPAFWYELERSFRDCWNTRRDMKVREHITISRGSNYIKIKLPSGRLMYYHQVQIGNDNKISYFSHSRKFRVYLWGGVLAENVTQAFARDIMTDRIEMLERYHLPVALHVHDEIIASVEEGGRNAGQTMFDMVTNEAPLWCGGFPLKTESEISERYHK